MNPKVQYKEKKCTSYIHANM